MTELEKAMHDVEYAKRAANVADWNALEAKAVYTRKVAKSYEAQAELQAARIRLADAERHELAKLELRDRKPAGTMTASEAIAALSPAPESAGERFAHEVLYVMQDGVTGSGAYETEEEARVFYANLAADPTVKKAQRNAIVSGVWKVIEELPDQTAGREPLGCMEPGSGDEPEVPEGFTNWEGGPCPLVAGNLEVLTREGVRFFRVSALSVLPSRWTWSDGIEAAEHIIAYRIIEPSAEAQSKDEAPEINLESDETDDEIKARIDRQLSAALEREFSTPPTDEPERDEAAAYAPVNQPEAIVTHLAQEANREADEILRAREVEERRRKFWPFNAKVEA